jgi:hypothetical protein
MRGRNLLLYQQICRYSETRYGCKCRAEPRPDTPSPIERKGE